MTENNDEEVLERAREIQSDLGISLADAMQVAQKQLAPEVVIPEEFTVTIPVKPRVAAWIIDEFGGHQIKLEERLGAYLAQLLNHMRITALRAGSEAPDVQQGRAVTMTRAQLKAKGIE